MGLASPIIKKINDNETSLNKLEKELNVLNNSKEKRIVKDYPTVYIHTWKNKNQWEVYVGESNNIFKRTREHFGESCNKKNWQYNLNKNKADLFIIGHEHFNKSLTLDIENRLIHYLTGVENVKKVHNSRGNPQIQYYPSDEFNTIFQKIWRKLRQYNENIFPLESSVVDSAIFKASPLHKLTSKQQQIKDLILNRIIGTLLTNRRGQLIFIEGEAGTGKTVLNSSIFYELCSKSETTFEKESEDSIKKLKCCLIINHKEQEKVYRQIFDKLCLNDHDLVYSPTTFINKYKVDDPIDVAFVDEAHLLLTQGKQSYTGKNQLQDILNRSKVVVVMFDPNQILTTEQYWEYELLEKYKNIAKENDNYFVLKEQLRIQANHEVINWIDNFTKKGIVDKIPKHLDGYEIKVFDNPKKLEKAIKEKAKCENSRLSRLVATYDWDYSPYYKNNNGYWEVKIEDWHKPWNYEIERNFNRKEKQAIRGLSWAEQQHTINEIGSTFTIQGFDLNYVGVILGPSVKYRDNKIVFDSSCSSNNKAVQNRTLSDGTSKKFGEILLKNELRILMTRGINGLYIFACDDELRNHLKNV